MTNQTVAAMNECWRSLREHAEATARERLARRVLADAEAAQRAAAARVSDAYQRLAGAMADEVEQERKGEQG